MSFNDAIEIDFDYRALNYLIGITNNPNINSNNFFDSVNNVFIIDDININADQLNFNINNESINVKNIGILSNLYSDFSKYVSNYFTQPVPTSGGFATLFSGVYNFNPNNGIFDTEELIKVCKDSLHGSIQLNGVTENLTYAVTNNPFGNRTPSSSILDGFYPGDLIFFSNGLRMTLNIPINTSLTPTIKRPLIGERSYLSETTISSTLTEITKTNTSEISRVVSVPLLLRLVNFNTMEMMNTLILEHAFVESNTNVVLNTSLATISTFISTDTALKNALTLGLSYVARNLSIANAEFNNINSSTLKNNVTGVFQSSLDLLRASQIEYNINKKLTELNQSYSTTMALLVSATKLSLVSKYQLDILANNIAIDKRIMNLSQNYEQAIEENMTITAETFISLENNTAIAFSISHANYILTSDTIIKNIVYKNDQITSDILNTDFLTIQSYLNSLNPTASVSATTFTYSIITPGVYYSAAAAAITGTITFDGQSNSNSLFVIRLVGALSTAANVKMNLINGALASNIYWVIVGAASLGANTIFVGNIISNAAISIGVNCKIYGRLFGIGAISINNSIILSPGISSTVNLYNLSQFVLYSGGVISNVDGGICTVMGSIGAKGRIIFATPTTSPFIVIGNVYGIEPNSTGATISINGLIYSNNNLYIKYGILKDLANSNMNGYFILVNEPLGLMIDNLSGTISIVSNINIGVYEFFVSYYSYNDKSSIVTTLVLSIIPNITVADILSSIDTIISNQEYSIINSEAILNYALSNQLDISNIVSLTPTIDPSKLEVTKYDSILFIQNAIKIMDTTLNKIHSYTFVNLDFDLFHILGYLNSLRPTVNIIATTFTNSILYPGIYNSAAAAAITGTITFDGQSNSNSLFVIRLVGALSTAASVKMNLINGALASNIYWVMVGAVSLGANTVFVGNIISNAAISIGVNCKVYGRLFGIGAISINNSNILSPATASVINLYSLSIFSVYSGGVISNVDGGICTVMGSIGSGQGITFATPLTSPFIVIGSIYCALPENTGASISTQGYLYPNNTLTLNYGDTSESIVPSFINGKYSLINEPLGLIIDSLSGVITFKSAVDIGIKQFYVSCYNSNNNSSIISIIVLSII
jgi:hypothetical protein